MKKIISQYISMPYLTIASGVVGVLLMGFVGVLVVVPEHRGVNGLNTLQELVWYAEHSNELPPMDNTNMVRPDYNSWYRATQPSWLKRKWRALLSCLGISTRFTWSAQYFLSLLHLSDVRLQSYKIEKNIVFKITPTTKTRCIVIGDLSGAYHSLVRDLVQLKKLGILDDALKIIAPDTYLIFMGDTISRSPYGMETLGVILRLMEVNPETVIYMRGNHEDNKYWESFGLKEQLEIRLGSEAVGAVESINRIFMRLPLGLYFPVPQLPHHYIRLSHLSKAESTKLHEESYAHFLEAKQQGLIDRHEITKTVQHNEATVIDAVLHSEKKRHTYQMSDGLRQLPSDEGVIAWTVMSAPTLVNQKGFQCYDDAFVIIQAAEAKDDWTITLYSHDTRESTGFITKTFRFFTGAPLDSAVVVAAKTGASGSNSQRGAPNIKQQPDVTSVASFDSPTHKMDDITRAIRSPFVQLLAGKIRKKSPSDRSFVKL
ncbi:MAG: metallophosphoesterase [bacterium]